MLSVLDKTCNGIIKVLRAIIITMLLIMTVITFVNIITRYFFGFALAWTDETARYMMIMVTFFGGAIATYHDTNIAIDLVPDLFKKLKFKRLRLAKKLCKPPLSDRIITTEVYLNGEKGKELNEATH